MNPETLFSMSNTLAMLGWLLLIMAPRWQWTKHLVLSGVFILILATEYTLLIILFFGATEGGFGTLNQVAQLFENPWALLAGWVHYLAFDLFVGSWEVSNAQKIGINHFLVIPCLLLTFFLGPIGLLLYFVVRTVVTKNLRHENF
jgi:hypothetical protein